MKKTLLCLSLFLTVTIAKSQVYPMWDTLGKGTGGVMPHIKAMAINDTDDNIIYVGGDFSTAEGNLCNHIAQWKSIGGYNQNGKWSSFGLGVNGGVTAISVFKHKLYVGGVFDSAGGVRAHYIACWDNIGGWDSLPGSINGQVYTMLASDSTLYVGGTFTMVNGISVNRIAKWNGSKWSAVGTGFDSNAVYTLASYNDTLYAGGSFVTSNGSYVNHISRWNGISWDSLKSGTNNIVYALDSFNYQLYVGGAFTKAGNTNSNYIATWSIDKWDSLDLGTNDTVRALTPSGAVPALIEKRLTEYYSGGAIVAGGSFTTAGGISSKYVALYFVDAFPANGISTGWNGINGLNGPVYALTSNTSDTYVGGAFDTINSGYSGIMQANYVGQFTYVLGTGINEFSDNNSISVSPNPNNGNFEIELKTTNEEQKTVEVYNVLGEKVYENHFLASRSALNLTGQSEGVYLLRLKDSKDNLLGTGKLIIAK